MTSNNRIQAAKIGYILISILLCLLGAVLIAVPDFSAVLLCRISSILLMAFGIVKIIGYFSKDLYRLAFQFDLAYGILMIAVGAVLVIRAYAVVQVVCVFLGICVLSDAFLKIQISMDSKAFGIGKWWLIFSAAILTGIVGFLLVLHPSESTQIIMTLLGAALLAEGILNLITILTVVKIFRDHKQIVVDARYREIE